MGPPGAWTQCMNGTPAYCACVLALGFFWMNSHENLRNRHWERPRTSSRRTNSGDAKRNGRSHMVENDITGVVKRPFFSPCEVPPTEGLRNGIENHGNTTGNGHYFWNWNFYFWNQTKKNKKIINKNNKKSTRKCDFIFIFFWFFFIFFWFFFLFFWIFFSVNAIGNSICQCVFGALDSRICAPILSKSPRPFRAVSGPRIPTLARKK